MATKEEREKLRAEAFEAHDKFLSGDIDGYEREQIVKRYASLYGVTSLDPNDTDSFVKAIEKAETEEDIRLAYMLRDSANNRDRELMGRLEPGTRRIYDSGIDKVKDGRRSAESFDRGIQRYRDATEKTIRKSELSKRQFGANAATPGIEWQGGQLRAGSVRGEVMPAELACILFIDKYHRSSMPKNGIVPNVSVSGVNTDGEVVTVKVPEDIMQAVYQDSANGVQPDATAMIEWLDSIAAEYDIYDNEFDMYADDSDTPIT